MAAELDVILKTIELGDTVDGQFQIYANEGTFVIQFWIDTKTIDENGEPVYETFEQEIPKQMIQMAKMMGIV